MKIWKIEDSKQFFETIVKYSENDLKKILSKKEEFYGEEIQIPKKNGFRKVYLIDKAQDLNVVQNNITKNFLNNIKLSDASCGFVKGSSYFDFLEIHTDFYKNRKFLRLDIKDFFGSISKDTVIEVLSFYCNDMDGAEEEILQYLGDILTYDDKVIQGIVSSPILSNIVFRELDIRIIKYCNEFDVRYSRYADDLLFSGTDGKIFKKSFFNGIAKILGSKGFEINYDKIIRSQSYISLNGFVISDSIKLSRKKLNRINRVIFFLKNNKNFIEIKKDNFAELNEHMKKEENINYDSFSGKYELSNYLNGYRAFLINVMKNSDDEAFIKKANKIIFQIEDIVDRMLA